MPRRATVPASPWRRGHHRDRFPYDDDGGSYELGLHLPYASGPRRPGGQADVTPRPDHFGWSVAIDGATVVVGPTTTTAEEGLGRLPTTGGAITPGGQADGRRRRGYGRFSPWRLGNTVVVGAYGKGPSTSSARATAAPRRSGRQADGADTTAFDNFGYRDLDGDSVVIGAVLRRPEWLQLGFGLRLRPNMPTSQPTTGAPTPRPTPVPTPQPSRRPRADVSTDDWSTDAPTDAEPTRQQQQLATRDNPDLRRRGRLRVGPSPMCFIGWRRRCRLPPPPPINEAPRGPRTDGRLVRGQVALCQQWGPFPRPSY